MATDADATNEGNVFDLNAWLNYQFDSAGRVVPAFESTGTNLSQLKKLAVISTAKTQMAEILANDFRQKAAEYRGEAARYCEMLEKMGLTRENMLATMVTSAQVIASVANLLNVRDTELSSFLVASADLTLRKASIQEKRNAAQKESKILLEHTRNAIAKLTHLKRTLAQLESDVGPCEARVENWKTNLAVMASKERQYMQQYSNYKALLDRVGYSPEISHSMLLQMADRKKELEKKSKPVIDTLRSYQDLPPDKALASLAIEDKKRQYAAAERYLEDLLHSALTTSK